MSNLPRGNAVLEKFELPVCEAVDSGLGARATSASDSESCVSLWQLIIFQCWGLTWLVE